MRAKFHLDTLNRLATVHERHGQTGQTDKKIAKIPFRSDSIWRTVLQTVAQKLQTYQEPEPKDILPNINRTQAAERAEKRPLSLMTFDL